MANVPFLYLPRPYKAKYHADPEKMRNAAMLAAEKLGQDIEYINNFRADWLEKYTPHKVDPKDCPSSEYFGMLRRFRNGGSGSVSV
ncbi:MAG: hypothetical protein AAFO75_07250 [Pseudomonadota bacterium]